MADYDQLKNLRVKLMSKKKAVTHSMVTILNDASFQFFSTSFDAVLIDIK